MCKYIIDPISISSLVCHKPILMYLSKTATQRHDYPATQFLHIKL